MKKLYVITYLTNVEVEDCTFSTSWEKAVELLDKKPGKKQIIEYTFNEDGISDFWTAIYRYKGGKLVCETTLEEGAK